MALKQPFLVKTVRGSNAISLQADPGQAFLVKDIMVRSPAESYITVRIEKTTVGYFRMKGPYGGHVAFRRGHAQHSHTLRAEGTAAGITFENRAIRDAAGQSRRFGWLVDQTLDADQHDEVQALMWSGFHHNPTILKYLGDLGIFKGFPIAEGETLTLSGILGTNAITLIVYEQWEPGDISPEDENGSKSLEYLFLNYGDSGDNIDSAANTLYDNPVSPAEFPDFPFGKVVPAKHEIDIIGILGSPRASGENNDTNWIYTDFIKMVKDREVLFDDDRAGLLFSHPSKNVESGIDQTAEGFTMIGNLSEYDNNPPLMFPVPLTFVAGDELNIYLTTVAGGTVPTLAADEQEIALIEKVRRLT
ncbi:hypothetical protein ES703_62151 [subsurface metagenome]